MGSYTNGVLSNGISFEGIQGDGRGQTIAIVDAYDYPTAATDLNNFSSYFGLPTFGGTGNPTFMKLNQTGGTTLPGTDPSGPGGDDWEQEEALDIEWAHVMAPMANIILFEANDGNTSNNLANLYATVKTAANTPGVVAVSMSWEWNEFSGELSNDTTDFVTPSGHLGGSATIGGTDLAGNVTFVTSAGDYGAYGPGDSSIAPTYPASSPNVVAVGGTTLTVNGSNPNYTYGSETGWSLGSDSWNTNLAGGGGISSYESQPAYQNGVVNAFSTSKRTYPDISLEADPNTGVPVYDSWDYGNSTPWFNGLTGGTSLSSPMFAGMIAVADEGRAIIGEGSLDGRNQVLPTLYNLAENATAYARDFHDITSGHNGPSPTYVAGVGYDLVTGLGSSIGNELIPALAGGIQLSFAQQPVNMVIGNGNALPTFTVDVRDAAGNLVSGDNSYVGVEAYTGPSAGIFASAPVVNGVATFSGVVPSTVGTYSLLAYDGTLEWSVSNTFTVQDTTTTTVSSSNLNYASYGQPVTFTATVTPASNFSGETGTVQFQFNGGNLGSPVALTGNTASYTTSTLAPGVYSVTAVYGGDGTFIGSSSSSIAQDYGPYNGYVDISDTFTFDGSERVSAANLNGISAEFPPPDPGAIWTCAQLYDGGSFTFGGNAANGYIVPNTNHTSDLASLSQTLAYGSTSIYTVEANLYPDMGNATDMGYLAVGFFKEQSGNYLWQSGMTALSLQLQPNGNWSLQTGGSSNYTHIASGNISLSAYTPATAPLVSLVWDTANNTASGSIGSTTLFTNLAMPSQVSYTTVKAVGFARDATLGANSRVDNFAFMQSTAPPAWLTPNSLATWSSSTQYLAVNGNTTIIGDPANFSANPYIWITGNSSQLTIDTTVADGGDGDGVVQVAWINGSGTITVNPRNSLLVGNFSQPALVNYGAVAIDGNGTIGQLSGSGNLTIGTGSSNNTVQLTAATTPDSVTDTQSAVTINAGSTLDITNNTLLINYGSGSTPLAAVQAAVAYGVGVSGASGAYGSIISSTANAGTPGQYTVGYADSTELSSIASGNVEVMYTLTGDANLDGRVNFNDFSLLQNNYDQSGRDWSQGDYNHDGLVNFNDFSLLQNNYDQNIAAAIFSSAAIGGDAASAANSTAAATSSAAVVYGVYSPASQTPLFTNDLIEPDGDAAMYG